MGASVDGSEVMRQLERIRDFNANSEYRRPVCEAAIAFVLRGSVPPQSVCLQSGFEIRLNFDDGVTVCFSSCLSSDPSEIEIDVRRVAISKSVREALGDFLWLSRKS